MEPTEPTEKVFKNERKNCYYCNKMVTVCNMSTHLKVCKAKPQESPPPKTASQHAYDELSKENERLKDELHKSQLEIQVLNNIIDKFFTKVSPMQMDLLKK